MAARSLLQGSSGPVDDAVAARRGHGGAGARSLLLEITLLIVILLVVGFDALRRQAVDFGLPGNVDQYRRIQKMLIAIDDCTLNFSSSFLTSISMRSSV